MAGSTESRSGWVGTVAILVAALCGGCVSPRQTPVPNMDAFCGDWIVRYLPPGKMAVEYAMAGTELPASDPGQPMLFGDALRVERQGDRLRYGNHLAEVYLIMGGINGEVPHVYAVGRGETEFGVDISVLYPDLEGRVFGTWSCVFWGLNRALPPVTNSAAFVLERRQGPSDAAHTDEGPPGAHPPGESDVEAGAPTWHGYAQQ